MVVESRWDPDFGFPVGGFVLVYGRRVFKVKVNSVVVTHVSLRMVEMEVKFFLELRSGSLA